MKLKRMVDNYNKTFGKKFPGSRLSLCKNFITGIWMVGNNYKNKSRLYGAYPPGYVDRILSMFGDAIKRENVVHLFSGSLDEGITIDVNPGLKPTLNCDACELSKFRKELKRPKVVMADPPYSHADAEKYGYPMPNRKKVLHEVYNILHPKGFLIWLDTTFPMYRKTEFTLVGLIGIVRSTNHRTRTVFIWRKNKKEVS